MIQEGEQIRWEFGGAVAEHPAIVFVSASAEEARGLRKIAAGRRWLVVNVPDLIGGQAVIDKLRPQLVVCDTEIEGRGSWRDLLKGQDAHPGFALIVASRHADDALWAEVLNLGGSDVLDEPFVVQEVERVIGSHFIPAGASMPSPQAP
jgi:DNA-binding NtrC family response regulator